MRNGHIKRFGIGVMAVAMAALPISGCSTAGFSSFGSSKLEIADISNKGVTTADGALIQARGHFRNNDFGYSAAYYKRVVELDPNNVQGYVGLSASYDRLGRYDLADRVYAAMFKMTGGTSQYYNNLGYSHMMRGNLKIALANFRSAEQLDPTNMVIANNIQLLADAAASISA